MKVVRSLQVWCNATDLAGNGRVNGEDFFKFTTASEATFGASTTYTVTIMFEPTGDKAGTISIIG